MLEGNYNISEVEKRIREFWEREGVFKFKNDGRPIFSIDNPPPTISGEIHMGHVMGYTPAEFIARYKRMRGFDVFYPMGFDDNGLPTERYVEKKNNVKAFTMPRDQFIKLCLRETEAAERQFKEIWQRLGISVDWSLCYSTINDLCRKISQRSFIELYEKGYVYHADAPITWCTACQTAVAQAELEDLKRTTKLNFINFDVEGGGKITIATTRPELLPACVGIFVNPSDGRYKSLIGKSAVVPVFGQKVEIMADELVDPNFGTGIVMVCTFGDTTDILWVQKHKLQTKIVIDKNGCLTKDAGRFAGLPLSKAREEIIKELAASGALLKQEQLEQVVNVHERCGTPVEYIISKEWWIRICDSKEKWLELGNKINWYPDYMKNRYETWVNGLNADWCISRQRYFGVPFPVWYCKKCGTAVLADAKDLPVDPFVDKPKHPCKCGSREFEPERSVMDTWTTSAITPLINVKWREADERKIYPMSLRPQGHDIIRTWAFYTIAKCWMHTDEIPWTAIMINGHALDPHGKKMSKSKGNIVEAIATIDKFGADPVRYWAASAKLGSDILYKEQEILRGKRLVTKLWNASKLVSIAIKSVPQDMPELYIIDKWLLAKLSNVIETSTDAFERYEYSNALAAVENFFWHGFCDNYLEIVKQRIYRSDPAVSWTLYHAFLALLKLLAPFLVYITEELFHKLYPNEGRSIHIASWPEPFEKDEGALSAGELLIEILTEVRNWKHKLKLPLNQPLSKIVINCSFEQRDTIKRVEEDLKAATCAREISFGFAEKLTLPSGIKIDIFV